MQRLTMILILIVLVFAQNGISVHASSSAFEQGKGFEQGAYEKDAEQPTAFNWSRQARFPGITSKPAEKWRFLTKSPLNYPVFSEDGTIYFKTAGGKLYALSPQGKVKWKWDYASYLALGMNHDVFVMDTDNNLYHLNSKGKVDWSKNVDVDKIVTGLIIDNNEGNIYLTSKDKIYAVDSTDGSVKWEIETNEEIILRPQISLNGLLRQERASKMVFHNFR